MVALDTQFAMLAVHCMLTLVSVSPPAAAVAVHSPHSNHGEDAGRFHRLHNPVIPTPNEKKSSSASKKHKGHKSSGASGDKETRAPTLNPPHAMFNTLGTEQPRDQKALRTRDLPLIGDVKGVLEAVEGLLKEVLSLPGDVLQVRHHGEYHFHDHDRKKIIIEDFENPLHVDIHKRTFLQHVRPSRRGDKVEERRDQEAVPGSVAVVSDDDEMFLFLGQGASDLVASRENASKMYLVEAPPSSSTSSPNDTMTVPVRLLCDPPSASGQVSCVTFNCNSSSPQPMNVTSCDNSPGAEGHASQLFSYNLASHELRPSCSNVNGSGADSMEGKGALLSTRDPGNYNNAMLIFRPSLAPEDLQSASATSDAPTSVTTVTVTTTATLTEPTSSPSADAADMALTSASENSPQESTSASSLSSAPSPATLNVAVALPSTTTADDSTSLDSAPSTTVSPAGGAVATSPSSGSEASSSPRPASFVVQAEEEKGDTVSGSQ